MKYLHSHSIIFRDLKPANIGFDGKIPPNDTSIVYWSGKNHTILSFIYLTYLNPFLTMSNVFIVRGDVSIIFSIADSIVSTHLSCVDFIIHHSSLLVNFECINRSKYLISDWLVWYLKATTLTTIHSKCQVLAHPGKHCILSWLQLLWEFNLPTYTGSLCVK